MTSSLSPEAILYGRLRRGPSQPPILLDKDGAAIYKHVETKMPTFYPSTDPPRLFFTEAPGDFTWPEALDAGVVHRLGGPAAVWTGDQEAWYRHGKLHNEFGPAKITLTSRGYLLPLYYLEGVRISQERWQHWLDTHQLH